MPRHRLLQILHKVEELPSPEGGGPCSKRQRLATDLMAMKPYFLTEWATQKELGLDPLGSSKGLLKW